MIGHQRHLMVGLLGLASAGIFLSVQAIAGADEVVASKLVGTWVLTKVNGKKPPIEIELEFTKDGKVDYGFVKGTYKIDGNELMIQVTGGKGKKTQSRTATIDKLTDEILVIKSGREESEYKKKEIKKKQNKRKKR